MSPGVPNIMPDSLRQMRLTWTQPAWKRPGGLLRKLKESHRTTKGLHYNFQSKSLWSKIDYHRGFYAGGKKDPKRTA